MNAVANNEGGAVRPGEDLDWSALDSVLKKVMPGLSGKPAVSQFPGGKSNLTYRLKYDNDDLVVRRPPFGTKARSAHSMIREYQVMTGLKPVYPYVPDTLYYSDDESIIGSEFYLMRKVEGAVIKQELPPEWSLSEAQCRTFCTQFWEKLIELHQVDCVTAGLESFGRPQGYVERQVRGWNERFLRVITPDVDDFTEVQRWLECSMPPESGRRSVLHGDYRIDNVILNQQPTHEVLAVLDWEISALGEPLMDLGNALAYWMQPDDPPELLRLSMQPSTTPGMLSRREILDLYQDRTGIDTSDFEFYLVCGYWRVAVILQQIYYRFYHKQTDDDRFSGFGSAVQNLGTHCRRLIGA